MVDFVNPFKGRKPGEKASDQELISAVRLSLCAEEEAAHLYNTIAEFTDDKRIKKLMNDIADEERVHIGEFQKLLHELEPDEEDKVGEGMKEAEKKMGSAIEKIADEVDEPEGTEEPETLATPLI